MQVSTFSAQLGLGSELVDWYGDATSVPYGHLSIDLTPRTDDRLRYCTNKVPVLSKVYVSDRLKGLKSLEDERTKLLYFPCVSIIFPQTQKPLPSVLSKELRPVSLQMHNESVEKKPAKHERHHLAKFQSGVSCLLSLISKILKQGKDVLPSEKGLHLKKVFTPAVISQGS